MSSAGANMLSELRLGQTHKILLGVGFAFKYHGTHNWTASWIACGAQLAFQPSCDFSGNACWLA